VNLLITKIFYLLARFFKIKLIKIDFSVANVKRDDITRLQQKFEKLSAELDNDTQIDESISNLEKNTKYLLNTAKQYKYQVDHLRKQIENLESINDSLERKCFSNKITKPEL